VDHHRHFQSGFFLPKSDRELRRNHADRWVVKTGDADLHQHADAEVVIPPAKVSICSLRISVILLHGSDRSESFQPHSIINWVLAGKGGEVLVHGIFCPGVVEY
jgi:hypothetical protein